MEIRGIAKYIVNELVRRTNELSQGRNAGCFGLVNRDGIIDRITEISDGGLNGMPLRQQLNNITAMTGKCLLEGLEQLPDRAVLITTRPSHTGLITDINGVDFFNVPLVAIGIKNGRLAGVGLIYPQPEHFDLATQTELIDLRILAAQTMEEEKEIMRRSTEMSLKFLDLSSVIKVEEVPEQPRLTREDFTKPVWKLPRLRINSISEELVKQLVDKSMEAGQGREVAMMAKIDENGHVMARGETVVGGIGYVPSRMLASSCVDIKGKSLRHIYAREVPQDAVIVHTHPGGTGVMHIGDANAGPGTWGRPIIAIGHDNDGRVRGATVIETVDKIFTLAEEDERLGKMFFEAKTPEEETEIRNRKFGIAQEFTNLCKPIEIKQYVW
ncbi:MAG: peptidase S7 [Bacillota bacterium]